MSHDPERAYVQSMLDIADDRHVAVIESMQTDVDRLRDTWSAGYAEQRQAAEARIDAIRSETRQYLASRYSDAEPETAHIDVAGAEDASVSSGHRSQQPNSDPRAAELERARAIAQMPLDEYAKRRAELGIGSAANTGLFG